MPKRPRRLLTVFNTGPDPPELPIVDPNCPHWERIQEVSGYALSLDLRKQFGKLTYSCLIFGAKGETGAASISAEKARIESIKFATARFHNAVFSTILPAGGVSAKTQEGAQSELIPLTDDDVSASDYPRWEFLPHSRVTWRDHPDPSNANCELVALAADDLVAARAAASDADCRLNRKLKELEIATVDDGLHELSKLLIKIARACNEVSNDLMEMDKRAHIHGVYWEGVSWDRWIVALSDELDARGLPTEARRTDEPSPFVLLVRELQKCLPSEFRRHTQSDDALRKAITRAREALASGTQKPPAE